MLILRPHEIVALIASADPATLRQLEEDLEREGRDADGVHLERIKLLRQSIAARTATA